MLVYCKNGQISSPIVSSLAQIMIDPYYRTISGFHKLVLKEWVYFGHNFVRYLDLKGDDSFCPAFILFLDCVNQLALQNEISFEFNSDYLLEIAKRLFSNLYFEFLHTVQRYELGSVREA